MSAPQRAPSPLEAAPATTEPELGVKDVSSVIDGLAGALADTYQLVIKSHAYHWNVVGPMFYSIHNLTEEQYTNMFEAADELAERMRALGALAPMNFSAMTLSGSIAAAEGTPTAQEMVADLAASHEALARRLHELIGAAGDASDPVTEDLATERSAFHQKAAWMLRSTIAA